MPKPTRREKFAGRYFNWILYARDGVWQADGRSNHPGLGRHSLGTTDPQEARRLLADLDLTMAVKHNLADRAAMAATLPHELTIEDGRDLYLKYAGRPDVLGGVRKTTLKRYRPVFDKFQDFCRRRNLTSWNHVTTATLRDYIQELEHRGYADRGLYLELNILKAAISWLSEEGHLTGSPKIKLKMEKPTGTDTYCWRQEEVLAMISFCRAHPDLSWLADVILALSSTGMRISELANLRWRDLELETGMIRLVDESSSRRARQAGTTRTLKSGRDRSLPIQSSLLERLKALPRHVDGFVFHGPNGGRLNADTVRTILIRDVLKPLAPRFPSSADEAGFVDGRLHSFRHFFASYCANHGVPQRMVMTWLGHSDSEMVEHYYHLHDEEAKQQMNGLNLYNEQSEGTVPPLD